MYYKVVAGSFSFTTLCEANHMVLAPGVVFEAPKKQDENIEHSEILVDSTHFHFAEGALDAMLWRSYLFDGRYTPVVWRVEPFGCVKKERCKDEAGLYQCGAQKIKFLQVENIDSMYELALEEYKENPNKYANLDIDVEALRKHQLAPLGVRKFYYSK